jgi:hypothetical protein
MLSNLFIFPATLLSTPNDILLRVSPTPNMTETKANNEHNEGQLNHSESTVATNTSQSTMQPENSSFAPNGVSPTPKDASTTKINLRQRLKHFTFAWFLCTMSTGGLSIALAETPHKFRGT